MGVQTNVFQEETRAAINGLLSAMVEVQAAVNELKIHRPGIQRRGATSSDETTGGSCRAPTSATPAHLGIDQWAGS